MGELTKPNQQILKGTILSNTYWGVLKVMEDTYSNFAGPAVVIEPGKCGKAKDEIIYICFCPSNRAFEIVSVPGQSTLERFANHWHTEGERLEAMQAPAARIKGETLKQCAAELRAILKQ